VRRVSSRHLVQDPAQEPHHKRESNALEHVAKEVRVHCLLLPSLEDSEDALNLADKVLKQRRRLPLPRFQPLNALAMRLLFCPHTDEHCSTRNGAACKENADGLF